jgi:hypothetical protein
MKTAFSVFVQFLLFFVVFFAFTLLDPFHMRWFVTHPTHTSTRYFVPDGLVVAFAVYFLLIGVEALSKKFPQRAPWTTLAFLLALILGLLSKFGFATHELF